MLSNVADKPKVYMSISVSLSCISAVCFSVSYGTLPVLPPHPTTSIVTSELLFGPTRSFVWGTYYHFLRDARYFPFDTWMRRVGSGNLVIACFSTFLPAYSDHFLHAFRGSGQTNRTGFAKLSAFSAVSLIFGYATPILLHYRERSLHLLV